MGLGEERGAGEPLTCLKQQCSALSGWPLVQLFTFPTQPINVN
jgi:hypothetical protein